MDKSLPNSPIPVYDIVMEIQRQSLVQQQQLKMNPQLLQSIKLMEMPLADLREKIEQELERNPALKIIKDKSSVSLDEAKTKFLKTTSRLERRSSAMSSEEHRAFIEGVLAQPETLQEHLLRQLQLEPIDEELRSIAETLIQNLDEDGFHEENPETLFSQEQPRLPEAMNIIRGLEPEGTCTSDYRESLLVQISLLSDTPKEIQNGIAKALENLDLLDRGKFSSLAKKIGLDEENTLIVSDCLKKLSPFPGRTFASSASDVRYVIPDIRVLRDGDELLINMNDEFFPVLGTNKFLEKLSSNAYNDQEARDFAREKIREARLFINHLNQRNRTLIRVANAILIYQRSFFIKGPKFLAPLTLGDIAKELNVHETTISRTANGKYMQTEWGIFEIRHFFSNSISGSGSGGSQYSKNSVKEIIKEIINIENRLLTDSEISALLNQKGIALARRTVAKYRKELDMGSSYTRKVGK